VITNAKIAAAFDEMADLLELSGENAFRIRAYRNGSRAIAEGSESIAQWVLDGKDLTTIDGIGSTLAEKTAVLVKTGGLPQLDALREKVPPSLRDIMTIPGVGAKKAMKLYTELSIKDLASLRSACETGLVANLKGFGEKTQAAILENMEIAEKATQRLLMDRADVLVHRIRTYMQSCQAIGKMEFAGSYRRGKETVGDLDLLVTSSNPNDVMDHFSKLPIIMEIIQRGDTKMSVRVTDSFQVDLRVVEESSWGAALQYFTGSKEHNVHIRGLAKAQGLKINEYGVYKIDDETHPVAGKNEEEIYHLLGLPWVPPELREDRIEFLPNAQEWIDDLIELADIRGDLPPQREASSISRSPTTPNELAWHEASMRRDSCNSGAKSINSIGMPVHRAGFLKVWNATSWKMEIWTSATNAWLKQTGLLRAFTMAKNNLANKLRSES
jgi:DNA polymerase (family 10)